MVEIKQKLISVEKYSIKCPYYMTPEFIVIHNTYNDASAENEVSYMCRNNDKVSFHYAVDDKCIIQGIPEDRNAFHAGDGRYGDGNRKGLSIEICYSLSGGDRFIKAEKNAAEFCAYLLKQYGWGIEKITKHQDYSDKYCPHRTLDMGWERFIDMIKTYMDKETPFTDISDTHWAYKHIIELNKQKILHGYSDGTFRPLNNITRAEAASLIYNTCNIQLSDKYMKYYNKRFPDVPENHWAYDKITFIYNIGIIKGYEDGSFRPDGAVTRAEFAVMVRNSVNIFGSYTKKWSKTFTDVPENHWAYSHINDLYNMGILTGKQNGIFVPNDIITRAEAAVMINKLNKYCMNMK